MRLLIADDNASLRKQLKRYFETRGHQVETARDGVEAWHQLRRNEPDVVLCDATMPHMTGYELARTVRRNPATEHVPVVLFSAQTDGELIQGRDFADDILRKPLDLDVLELRLVSMLKRIAVGREPTPQVQGRVTAVTSAAPNVKARRRTRRPGMLDDTNTAGAEGLGEGRRSMRQDVK